MLRAIRGFVRFWVDFIVGDDWRIAAGIAVVLVAGALLVHGRVIRTDAIAIGLPVIIVALVAASILRDARGMHGR
ncbi:MAG: hypothetical protein ABI317_01020 [Gaiellales bacterium]